MNLACENDGHKTTYIQNDKVSSLGKQYTIFGDNINNKIKKVI